MLFGILCTYALAYGAITLFGGIISLVPKIIEGVTDYVTETGEAIRDEDLQHLYKEGILDRNRFVLAEYFPAIVAFDLPELDEILSRGYILTTEELRELKLILQPADVFEQWSKLEPPAIRRLQMSQSMLPVIDFLSRVPKLRQFNLEGGT